MKHHNIGKDNETKQHLLSLPNNKKQDHSLPGVYPKRLPKPTDISRLTIPKAGGRFFTSNRGNPLVEMYRSTIPFPYILTRCGGVWWCKAEFGTKKMIHI